MHDEERATLKEVLRPLVDYTIGDWWANGDWLNPERLLEIWLNILDEHSIAKIVRGYPEEDEDGKRTDIEILNPVAVGCGGLISIDGHILERDERALMLIILLKK